MIKSSPALKNQCEKVMLPGSSVREIRLQSHPVVLGHRGVAVRLCDLDAALVGAAGGLAVAVSEVGRGEHPVGVALVVGAVQVLGQDFDRLAEAPGLLVL